MFESLKETLVIWNTKHNERVKLQHVYLALAVLLVFAAGIIGLLNQQLSQHILAVAIICAGIFLGNAVTWALLQSAITTRLTSRKTVVRKK